MNNIGESLKVWPEWKIEKVIGRGAFGTVYEAVRSEYGVENRSAIKVLSIPINRAEIDELAVEGYTVDQTDHYFKEMVDEFVKEIQFMENLKGIPNVVSIYDYKVLKKENEVGYEIYIRMELLTPLNDYLCDKKLTEEEVIKLGYDLCSVLELCSQKRILHRDIKPENIFVNEFGMFKLGDFGVARTLNQLTGLLSQKGTYSYSAPEILRGAEYDERSDIYSLGIVLYRLLNNNRFPFMNPDKQLLTPSEKMAAVERRIKGDALENPKNASEEMAKIILKACEYMPERRFANASQMKHALSEILNKNIMNEVENEMKASDEIKEEALDENIQEPISQSEDLHNSSDEKKEIKKKKDSSYSNGLSSVVVVNGLDSDNKNSKKIPIIIASVVLLILVGSFSLYKAGYIPLDAISNKVENKVVSESNTMQPVEEAINSETETVSGQTQEQTEEQKEEQTTVALAETETQESDDNDLENLFIGNGTKKDSSETTESAAQNYKKGMELLKSRNYAEAGQYLIKAVNNNKWLSDNFKKDERYDLEFIANNPDELGFTGTLARRIEAFYESDSNLYASIVKYYVENEYTLDHYSFATTDPGNSHVLIMVDCTLDGEVSYSELNTHAYNPVNRNKKACEGIAKELYQIGIENMKKGQFEEAGQYIINAINCKDWFLAYFQMETHYNPDFVLGGKFGGGYQAKKLVLYWKEMKDCFAAVVGEYYEEDVNVLSKYHVRMYDYETGDIHFYIYDSNGNFLCEE